MQPQPSHESAASGVCGLCAKILSETRNSASMNEPRDVAVTLSKSAAYNFQTDAFKGHLVNFEKNSMKRIHSCGAHSFEEVNPLGLGETKPKALLFYNPLF